MHGKLRLGLLFTLVCSSVGAGAPPLEHLFAEPEYRDFKISPDGNYYAVILPFEGRDSLVTLKGDKSAVVGRFGFRDSSESVGSYQWLKDDHLLIRPVTSYGWNDFPSWHGELFAARADGKDFRPIYGYRTGEQQVADGRTHRGSS